MGSSNVASLYFVSYIGHKVITVTFSPTISLPLPISASRSSFLCLSHFLFFSSRALSLSLSPSMPLSLCLSICLSLSLFLSYSLSVFLSLQVKLPDKLDVLFSFIKSHLKNKIIVFFATCSQVSTIIKVFDLHHQHSTFG